MFFSFNSVPSVVVAFKFSQNYLSYIHNHFIPKELMKLTSIAQEKSSLTRSELQEIDNYSHFTKSYGTILNSFSWPRSGEEQDVLHQTHNAVRVDFNQLD